MPAQKPIEKKKLLLAEGADAYFFAIWACQAFEVYDIQVLDFGGIGDLGEYLKTLKMLPNYENIKTFVIVRDAEGNPNGAVQSIQSALRNNAFSVPKKPFEFEGTELRVAYMIFPGFDQSSGVSSLLKGTLEDLCLSMTEGDLVHECVNEYIDCLKSKGIKLKHTHKTRLHSYLAGKNEFAGLKVGQAAKAGAWNWDHANIKPFRDIIKAM